MTASTINNGQETTTFEGTTQPAGTDAPTERPDSTTTNAGYPSGETTMPTTLSNEETTISSEGTTTPKESTTITNEGTTNVPNEGTTTSSEGSTEVPATEPATLTSQGTTASPATSKPPPANGNTTCPPTEDGQNVFVCPTGFKRHPLDCNLFYQCTSPNPDSYDLSIVVFKCPENTTYDEQGIKCDVPSESNQCNKAPTSRFTRAQKDEMLKKTPVSSNTKHYK